MLILNKTNFIDVDYILLHINDILTSNNVLSYHLITIYDSRISRFYI
jgi:hypothetical protein